MRVLIVDDHPLYREGLKALLTGIEPDVQVRGVADTAEAVALAGHGACFDLVLLDMNLPGASRIVALKQVRAAFEGASVVVVSGEEDPMLILQAIDEGAAGYIPKTTDPAVTINALRLVLAHGIYLPATALRHLASPAAALSGATAAPVTERAPDLSDRQRAVLRLLLQGKANKVIARDLDIAEGTVKAHLWAIYQALDVSSRAQAMCRVHELNMLESLR